MKTHWVRINFYRGKYRSDSHSHPSEDRVWKKLFKPNPLARFRFIATGIFGSPRAGNYIAFSGFREHDIDALTAIV
jgi:hypothetical protein